MPYLLALFAFCTLAAQGVAQIRVQGSTTVNPVVADAAEVFRQKGWKITLDTLGGSSGGISALGRGTVDLAMSSRPLTKSDQTKFPKVDFKPHEIGFDGVALVVSQALYDAGVQSLTRDQVKGLYEGTIKNWSAVGGPDRRVVFFNKEPGRGTWEVFANYLYGDAKHAPKVFHSEVGANEEARSKVATHKSAITQLSVAWVEPGKGVAALSLREGDALVTPSTENIRSGKYPMRRPLLVVTNGKPHGELESFIQYLRSPVGQGLVAKFGYLPLQ